MITYSGRTSAARIEDTTAILSADPDLTLDEIVATSNERFLDGEHVPLADVTLLAPLQPKKNVFCVGRNYLAHAEEITRARGIALDLPDVPTFFTKAPTTVVAHNTVVHMDATLSQMYDWEAELAVVIGKRCRDIAESDALDAVFGYCCMNDISARDLQQKHLQWFKGKSLDESGPLGPWIVTADELGDPQQLQIVCRINGVVKQDASTAHMIFPVARVIAELSQGLTLEPGDIIATGTPEGVGFARNPPEFFRNGDTVEVEIERIGVLKNTISLTETKGI